MIDIDWVGPRQFSVTVTDATRRLDCSVTLTTSPITRAMSGIGARLPEAVWRQRWFLAGMGAVAGPMMGAGKVSLVGRTPNGQRFVANPHSVWLVSDSKATLDGIDLGVIGPRQLPDKWPTFESPSGACSRSGGRSSDEGSTAYINRKEPPNVPVPVPPTHAREARPAATAGGRSTLATSTALTPCGCSRVSP